VIIIISEGEKEKIVIDYISDCYIYRSKLEQVLNLCMVV